MAKSYEASGKTVDEAIDLACMLAGTTIENVDIEILELGGKGLFGLGQKDARVKVTVEEKEQPEVKETTSTFGKKKQRRDTPKKNPQTQTEEIRPIIVVEPGDQVNPIEVNNSQNLNKSYNENKRTGGGYRRESNSTMIVEGEMKEQIYNAFISFAEPIFKEIGVNPEYRTEIREGILWIILSGEKLGLLIGRRGETLNAIQYLVNLAVNKKRNDHIRIVIDVEGYREGREQTLAALAHKMAEKAVKSGRRVELEPMNPHERRIVHIALQNDRRVETSSRGEEPYRRVVVSARRSGRKR